jgi:hypothetical protein
MEHVMKKVLITIASLAVLATAVAPASAAVRHPAARSHAQVVVPRTGDPDAFIRDYLRIDPPGAHWND